MKKIIAIITLLYAGSIPGVTSAQPFVGRPGQPPPGRANVPDNMTAYRDLEYVPKGHERQKFQGD